ncbi:class A beta-lactamase [Starkeya sp. ORNL1]|uniref:class A beta-lactamase n=1 Tax=Starkeya sp. ORNL1 TaxID=2709380 RepID=UPI00146286C4|nr:class A beta-lactamase [Starkeya sp. ORNL1]QJP12805.1 class A beta-lactamase [Starkeya sp. ORNL1]
MIDRRVFTAGLLPLIAGIALVAKTRPTFAAGSLQSQLDDQLPVLEKKTGGRLGVTIIDTADGTRAGYRADERFPMCSTFKALAAAAVLARVDAGKEQLDRIIRYAKSDLVTYSPTTEKHVADGMTLAALCEATITLSDNTAGNLLLANIGGPKGLTAYVRTLGDTMTRLDRNEPTLNEAKPGDPRDTTTPAAMAATLQRLVLGDSLSPASRQQLADWLVATKTGDERLRAGVPTGWRVGDKTGTGANNTANDIGVLWPPNRAPIVVTAYLTGARAAMPVRNAAIAEVGRLAAGVVG